MRNTLRIALVLSLPALAPVPARAQPISYFGEIAANCRSVPPGAVAQVMTVGTPGAIAGQTVIVAATASAGVAVASVVDSAGHAYAVDVEHAPSVRTFLASARLTNPLPATTGTITINWSNATGADQSACANVALFSNLATGAGYLDASGAAAGNDASPTVTTSAATTQPNDLVVGIFSVPDSVGAVKINAYLGPGFEGIAPEACLASPVPLCMHSEYKIVSATGPQTATAVLDPGAPWDALVAVYKGAAFSLGPTRFYTVVPCRLVDTRNADGPLGGPALQPGVARVFPVFQASCGIPAAAKALAINITAAEPPGTGHLQAFPSDEAAPPTSVLNFRAGQTRANNAVVRLPSDSSGGVTVLDGSPAAVHVIVDVNGYFQ